VVESDYEDEVMKLLEEDDRRAPFLLRIAPDLRALFGREARLMLAESWNLSDPPHQELRLILDTRLDRSAAEAAPRRSRGSVSR